MYTILRTTASKGCGKNFRGPEIIDTRNKASYWMGNLCEELSERLLKDQEENGRIAKTLNISITLENVGSISRSTSLFSYSKESLAKQALHLIANSNELPNSDPNWRPKIRNISLSSSKFIEMSQNHPSIQSYFKTVESCKLTEKVEPAEQSEITDDKEHNFPQSIIENPKETDTGSTSTDTDKVNSIEMVKCEKCDKEVSPFDLPEHLDYHVAKELQNEFRKEFAPRPLASHNSQKPISSTNGKRKSNGNATQMDSKKQKTISNFFLKK